MSTYFKKPAAKPKDSHDSEPVELDINDLLSLRTAAAQAEPALEKHLFQFPGPRPSARRGQGLEFEDLREYTPGDDLRFIDWNVTARTSRLHTRLYRDERERTTTVIVDLRDCMFTGSEALKARRAVTAAARLIWQAIGKGDRCSAIVFDDSSVEASRPLRSETGAINACQLLASKYQEKLKLKQKSTAPARGSSSAYRNDPKGLTGNGISQMFQLILSAGRLSGYSYVFSSGDNIENIHDELFQEVSAKGQLCWIMLLDKIEITGLPAGSYNYSSSDSLATKSTDSSSFFSRINTKHAIELREKLAARLTHRLSLFEQFSIPLLLSETLETDRHLTANLTELSLI